MYWDSSSIHEHTFASIEKLKLSLQDSPNYFPSCNHIILHKKEKLDFTYLKKIVIYCPEKGLFKTVNDNKYMQQCNGPEDAYNYLYTECTRHNIEICKKLLNADRWNKILEKPSQIGRFYGFRKKVLQ